MAGSRLISWMALYRANISSVVIQSLLWSNKRTGSPARRNTASVETPSSSSFRPSVPDSLNRFVIVSQYQESVFGVEFQHQWAIDTIQNLVIRFGRLWLTAPHTHSLPANASTVIGRRRHNARRTRHRWMPLGATGRVRGYGDETGCFLHGWSLRK